MADKDKKDTSPTQATQTQEEEKPFDPLADWNPLLKLRKPIELKNGNGEIVRSVTELKFREPTGADIENIGTNPVVMSIYEWPPKPTFNAPAMTQMMALLSGEPPSIIRQLSTRDWNTGAWKLVNFFTPDLTR